MATETRSPSAIGIDPDRADILALHRAGRLAAEYPRVRSALVDATGAERLRAGQLLARLGPDDVLAAHPSTTAVTVAVTGHGTVAGLLPPLTAELARHGLLLRPHLADFDSYVFDLADPSSALYAARPDLVVCLLDPQVVLDELPLPWQVDDVERVFAEKVQLVADLARRFATQAAGTLVLNTLPLLRQTVAQLVDHRSRAALGAVWREANAQLLRLTGTDPAIVVIDLDPLLAEGIEAVDPRLSIYAKAYLSPALLARYARELGHLARHLTGHTKKCLVLDLDETVWGGILGDDGADGIEMAGSRRGEAFRAFQRGVRQIASQGVLVAAVSKNDIEPVREVLRTHPDMTLREEDFVRVLANWRPKHLNVVDLAADLNIGLDSIVAIDDSPYERGLLRRELPALDVVVVDEEPGLHLNRLLIDGWFDVRQVTVEDLNRPSRYRSELVRKDFSDGFDSLTDYLRELGVQVRLERLDAADVPRVSQLALRTNQFNLSTRRRQPAQVQSLLDDPTATVLTIRAGDRFGDSEMVGALFIQHVDDGLWIDNFLLSCRVFSRGIEHACLSAVLRHARDSGATAVYGRYQPSAKNGKVADLYPRHGFAPAGANGAELIFRHDLVRIDPAPAHIALSTDLEDTQP